MICPNCKKDVSSISGTCPYCRTPLYPVSVTSQNHQLGDAMRILALVASIIAVVGLFLPFIEMFHKTFTGIGMFGLFSEYEYDSGTVEMLIYLIPVAASVISALAMFGAVSNPSIEVEKFAIITSLIAVVVMYFIFAGDMMDYVSTGFYMFELGGIATAIFAFLSGKL